MTTVNVGAFPTLNYRPTNLIMCDHCGIVGADVWDYGWKCFQDFDFSGTKGDEPGRVVWRHHCPLAVQYQDWIRDGLVHMVAPEAAVVYSDWDEEKAAHV